MKWVQIILSIIRSYRRTPVSRGNYFPLDPVVQRDDRHVNTLSHQEAIFPLIIFLSILLFPSFVSAANNKFGVHIAVPSDEDIQAAAELVNSNGGEYGYITLVIQDDRRDVHYWQSVFDKLREKKLIPIVRIATRPDGEVWKEPDISDMPNWVSFLEKLNWVTKDRLIIIFNEPNHATEWGGAVDPIAYGKVAARLARGLKAASADYKIMLAGLDLSAPEARIAYADAYTYLQESSKAFCGYLRETGITGECSDYIDAISSHAYPNPGFVGSPYDTGRKSIRGYEYEIAWHKALFGEKEYPVYITETGWDSNKLTQRTVASYFEYAYTNIWLPDDRVKAVTPFILNYQGQPFLGFSLLELGSLSPKAQFIAIQNIEKTKGEPEIVDKARLTGRIPKDFVEVGRNVVSLNIQNIGQAIWTDPGKYVVSVVSDPPLLSGQVNIPSIIKPYESMSIFLPIYSRDVLSDVSGKLIITLTKSSGEVVGRIGQDFTLHPRPSARINASLMSKGLSTGTDFELQVFDSAEKLVYRKMGLEIVLGKGVISELTNIIPNETYRFVLLKPYYLPRQKLLRVANGENIVKFDELLPFDMDKDGALTLGDVQGLFIRRSEADYGIVEKLNLFLPFK